MKDKGIKTPSDGSLPGESGSPGRRMVRAYGNKHSKVWVKARGDFA